MSQSIRAKFERDLCDIQLLQREIFLLIWRTSNPVVSVALACQSLFEQISESTPNRQKAELISDMLNKIEFSVSDEFEKDFPKCLADISNTIPICISDAAEIYPHIEALLHESIGGDEEKVSQSISKKLLDLVSGRRELYNQLYAHYLQLIRFLPRYSCIMMEGGDILRDGSGYSITSFGDFRKEFDISAWVAWEDASDSDFCQKFEDSFMHFSKLSLDYAVDLEHELLPLFDYIISERGKLERRIFDCYAKLAENGLDIEPIYRRYRILDVPLDDYTKDFFRAALTNLEENPCVTYKSIMNLKDIFQFD